MTKDLGPVVFAFICLALVLGLAMGRWAERGCGDPDPVVEEPLPAASVDASVALAPIDTALENRLAEIEGRLGTVEVEVVKRRVALARAQRVEYESVRDGGRGAVAEWLGTFNEGLVRDGGTSR